jgi:hypothetical protein
MSGNRLKAIDMEEEQRKTVHSSARNGELAPACFVGPHPITRLEALATSMFEEAKNEIQIFFEWRIRRWQLDERMILYITTLHYRAPGPKIGTQGTRN